MLDWGISDGQLSGPLTMKNLHSPALLSIFPLPFYKKTKKRNIVANMAHACKDSRRNVRHILPHHKPVRFPWRFAAYMLVLLYFVLDLYLFHGPLYKTIHSHQAEAIFEKSVGELAATVNAHPVTETELTEGIRIYCWQRGIDLDSLPPKRRTAIRALVLGERVDDILIWMFSRANPVDVPKERYDAEYASFRSQFQTEEEFTQRLKSQGFTEATLRTWLDTQLQQRLWIDSKIASEIVVTQDEARYWYAINSEQGEVPEVLRARHLFLATLDKDPAEVEARIRALHARLLSGEAEFAQLIAENSEDERSRAAGGDLNYFTRLRMPPDFYNAVDALEAGKISGPFQTKLGWHIAELVERKPGQMASFDELEPEITAMLESDKRAQAIPQLTKNYRGRARIRFFKHPTNG